MKLEDFMTLAEIGKDYKVKPATLRSYISRGQVIPEDKRIKIGETWLIDREFVEEKWGKNK